MFFYEKPQAEETVIMQNLAHFDSLFYHFLTHFKNFKNVVLGFSITQAKYWYQKSIMKMAMSPSL